MNRPTLFTIGYGMHNKPLCSRTDLLRECLEDAEVSVLLDIRDSPWGGYWNPKKFLEIFEESPIQYLLKDESIVWHKLFGASRKLRTMVSELHFMIPTIESLRKKTPTLSNSCSPLLKHIIASPSCAVNPTSQPMTIAIASLWLKVWFKKSSCIPSRSSISIWMHRIQTHKSTTELLHF